MDARAAVTLSVLLAKVHTPKLRDMHLVMKGSEDETSTIIMSSLSSMQPRISTQNNEGPSVLSRLQCLSLTLHTDEFTSILPPLRHRMLGIRNINLQYSGHIASVFEHALRCGVPGLRCDWISSKESTDTNIHEVQSGFPKTTEAALRTILLYGCGGRNTSTCSRLELRFRCVSDAPSGLVSMLIKRLPTLRHLCIHIDTDGLHSFPLKNWDPLKRLPSDDDHVTSDTTTSVTSNVAALQSLQIKFGRTNVRSDRLLAMVLRLLRNLPNLKELQLDVRGNVITDAAFVLTLDPEPRILHLRTLLVHRSVHPLLSDECISTLSDSIRRRGNHGMPISVKILVDSNEAPLSDEEDKILVTGRRTVQEIMLDGEAIMCKRMHL